MTDERKYIGSSFDDFLEEEGILEEVEEKARKNLEDIAAAKQKSLLLKEVKKDIHDTKELVEKIERIVIKN